MSLKHSYYCFATLCGSYALFRRWCAVRLERQVVYLVFSYGSCGLRRSSWLSGSGCGSCAECCTRHYAGLHAYGCRIDLTYVEGADVVEPATLILMCVNVERYGHFLTDLDIETADAVCTEYAEDILRG